MILITVIAVFQILGLISAAHSIMSSRTPQGSIAWAVCLVTVPYVAVPAYWVFGRNKFNGYVQARRSQLETLQELVRGANREIEAETAVSIRSSGAIMSAENLARIPLTGGNDVELLINGKATFDSIFKGIDAATNYIAVQFYIVRDDELGRELKKKLIAAAERGVRVFFIYDEVGSIGLPASYSRELESAGVEINPFHSRKGSGNRFQLNFRNHRKTVVVDGKTAWIGGHNVGDEYVDRGSQPGHWRDTHMRFSGPAVIGAQLAFVEDWRWATDVTLEDLVWEPQISADGSAQALVIASGPADEVETASLMFLQAINAATERLWIASPYFVPDDAIVQALQLAGLRGVDVRILIPEKPDNLLVMLAGYSYFSETKSTGVKIYRYQEGFLHSKVMLIDDDISMVGTANFDNRSFRLNFEATTLVIDEDFALNVKRMFDDDFSGSRIMEPDEYDNKPFWFRLAVRVARLSAPVL